MLRYLPFIVFMFCVGLAAIVFERDYAHSYFVMLTGALLALLAAAATHILLRLFFTASEEARQQRKNNRYIIHNHPALIMRLDPGGTIKYMNLKMEEVTGRSAQQLYGMHWNELFLPEEHIEDIRSLEKHFKNGHDIKDYEMMLRRASGKRGTISWTSLNDYDGAGDLREVILFGLDVTERNEFQGEIIAIKEQYQRLVEDQLDAILQYSPDGTIIFANKSAAGFLGYRDGDELIGENLRRFIREEEDKALEDALAALSVDRPILSFEFDVHTPHKGNRVTYWTNRAFYNHHKEVKYIQAIIRDVTEQRKAEDKLRKEKEKNDLLAHAVESSTVGITIADARQKDIPLTYANEAFLDITGYTRQEVLGRNCRFLQGDETSEDSVQIIREGIARNKDISVEILNYRKDGTTFWNIFMLSPVINEAGEVVAYIGIQQDISSRKKYEQELKQARMEADAANKAKSEFLANMSHEIRTPMNGIIGTASLLKKRVTDGKELRYIDIIINSGDQLLSIINDILDFSKIEAGELRLSNERFSLHQVIRGVYDLFKDQADSKQLSYEYKIDPELPEYCIGDHSRVRQLMTNFLSNAIKFTNKGSICLNVKLLERDENKMQVKFSVIDTGSGIAKKDQDKLFQKFSQVYDSVENAGLVGTGLGLSITKSVAEVMGGSVGLESERGKGSHFYAVVPLEYDDAQEPIIVEDHTNKIFSGSVLLIEDVPANQMVIKDMLEDYGLEVDTAQNGQIGVTMEEKGNYDLIFMDLRMPVMDGIQATGNIRMRHKEKDIHVPIIALTAHAIEETRQEALESGMDDFLSKPLKREVLGKVLAKWLGGGETIHEDEGKAFSESQEGKNNRKEKEKVDFDDQFIRDLYAKDPERAGKFVSMVAEDIRTRLDGLRDAAQVKDYEEIASLAHALKSVALQAGGMALAQKCRELEKEGKDKRPVRAKRALYTVEKGAKELEDRLRAFVSQE